MSALPTHGRRSYRRSELVRARVSPELKDRAEAAAAASGKTFTRWLEELLERNAPPLLDLPADAGESTGEAAVA